MDLLLSLTSSVLFIFLLTRVAKAYSLHPDSGSDPGFFFINGEFYSCSLLMMTWLPNIHVVLPLDGSTSKAWNVEGNEAPTVKRIMKLFENIALPTG